MLHQMVKLGTQRHSYSACYRSVARAVGGGPPIADSSDGGSRRALPRPGTFRVEALPEPSYGV